MTIRKKAHAIVVGIFIVTVLLSPSIYTFAASGNNEDHSSQGHSGEVADQKHETAGTHGNEHGFNWGQFIGKTINSIILFGGLILLLRKPIIKLLTQKTLEVKTDIQQREEELEKSSSQLKNLHKRLEKIEEEISNMKLSAQEGGNREKQRIEEVGAKEAQRILDLTDSEINMKIENSIRNLKSRIADLTIEHFKKDIQHQLDKKAHEKIIDKNIQRCGEISERK